MRQKIRRILAFVIAAVLIQGLALLFFTPAGIERLLFLPLRLHAEKFKPDNNAYAVYYDTRTDVAAADLIVVGIDTHVAESYDALGHFSRYVKQYNDFSAVLMPSWISRSTRSSTPVLTTPLRRMPSICS